MFVTHLSLADFRSYERAEVALRPGVSVFVGSNGQGKTNLVEAVEYLSTLSSHRVTSDIPLVRVGAQRALVRARVQAGHEDQRQLLLEVEITPGKANRAKLNRAVLPRARELVGILRTVVFAPDDQAIVKGDPAERRRFVDGLVILRWPRMAGVRGDYERVLKQRNALLKSLSGRPRSAVGDSTLDVWNDQLSRLGAELMEARLDTLADLAPHAANAYAAIAPRGSLASAAYKSALRWDAPPTRAELTDMLLAAMDARQADEVARGVSLVGPHRDDLELTLDGLPARGYASHGESWSFALALRVGSFHLLRDDGVQPVLVLDDVFAELDASRRERLADSIREAEQVLVTAAVPADVPGVLDGAQYTVADAAVTPTGGNDGRA